MEEREEKDRVGMVQEEATEEDPSVVDEMGPGAGKGATHRQELTAVRGRALMISVAMEA